MNPNGRRIPQGNGPPGGFEVACRTVTDTTHAMPPPATLEQEFLLVVVEGEDAGAQITVDRELTVGTSERADLVLQDRAVSRRHIVVRPGAVGVEVSDAQSRNGTWLGPCRVGTVDLPVDSEVRIGSTVLRVAAGTRAEPTEPVRASFGRFCGSSPSLGGLYRTLDAATKTDVTVLIEGESGTGKELLSEALHEHSARSHGPMIVVDCGSIPENLIESELFGHVRGAFTGAVDARAGAFELGQGGTVFLDEIGELPLVMQSRLLRVLDSRRIRRVGGKEWIDVDVRIVAATHRNLEREVEEGRFRLDLFHRLAVLLVRVPPLRSRFDDLPVLIPAILRSIGADAALLTDDLLRRVRSHPWPGNVRELRNYLERLALLGEAAVSPAAPRTSSMDDLARSGLPFRRAKADAVARFTELYVNDMLERHGGNVSHAAEAAGVARRHFQRLKRPTGD